MWGKSTIHGLQNIQYCFSQSLQHFKIHIKEKLFILLFSY